MFQVRCHGVKLYYCSEMLFQQHWRLQASICCMGIYFTDTLFKYSGLWGFLLASRVIVSYRYLYTRMVNYLHSMGIYMRTENRRRNEVQGVNITAADIDTQVLGLGPKSPSFRYMY